MPRLELRRQRVLRANGAGAVHSLQRTTLCLPFESRNVRLFSGKSTLGSISFICNLRYLIHKLSELLVHCSYVSGGRESYAMRKQ